MLLYNLGYYGNEWCFCSILRMFLTLSDVSLYFLAVKNALYVQIWPSFLPTTKYLTRKCRSLLANEVTFLFAKPTKNQGWVVFTCGGPPGGPSHVWYVQVCIRGRNGDGYAMTSSWNSSWSFTRSTRAAFKCHKFWSNHEYFFQMFYTA